MVGSILPWHRIQVKANVAIPHKTTQYWHVSVTIPRSDPELGGCAREMRTAVDRHQSTIMADYVVLLVEVTLSLAMLVLCKLYVST